MTDLTTDAGIAAVQARLRGESDRLTDAELDAIEQRPREWASLLAIKCPACGSNPGAKCYGNGPVNRAHKERREAVRQRVITVAPALVAEVRRLRAELAEERLRVRALQASEADHARDRDTIERILAALDGEQ